MLRVHTAISSMACEVVSRSSRPPARSGSRSSLAQRYGELAVERLQHQLVATALQQVGALQRGFELLLHIVAQVHRGDQRPRSGHSSTDQASAWPEGSCWLRDVSSSLPAVLRPSRSRCACGGFRQRIGPVDAQFQLPGRDPAQHVAGPPEQLLPRQAVVRQAGPREVTANPCAFRIVGSNGGTGPLDWPNSASMPRGRSEFRLFSKVVVPTES